ncbi:ParA family protein [Ruficoccus amylovorans]|uniref:ParA family protein n=1 Tax=Ruficoccus amylovorans TaxID=1804625 RepID=A0A842HF47_9BACT|nr:ParA family protein [Ruficoccus amylovorans]MBC2594256.1 ParA family protein [Ruficoccus amylovorans]
MSCTVFSIANQKGGVGKTTTAINLGWALAERKVPTLLIDLDPQANATSALGFEKTPGSSLYGALHGDGAAEERVIETRQKDLFLIGSEVDLAAIEIELGQQEDYLVRLREVLKPLRESGKYRAIILDCPPALGMISMNGLAAADYLLVALQCEYLAMEGLGQIMGVVDQLTSAGVNPNLAVGGILMTMYDKRTNLSRQVVQEVKEHLGELVFDTHIPRTVRLSEAPSFGQSIFEYERLGAGSHAYKKFAKEFIKRFGLK